MRDSDTDKVLTLSAFDPSRAAALPPELSELVRRRNRLFGTSSVLFYDRPLEIVRGEGCWLYDPQGVAYLDAYNNVPSVGHCHPRVVAAAAGQLAQLNVHNRYLHTGILAYAERLLATLPPALANVTFTCTGSEANDLALRLAARFTDAEGVIVTENAYHGSTALTAAVSPSSIQGPPHPHVRLVPPPDFRLPPERRAAEFTRQVATAVADLERQHIGVAALLIDSILSSDGVFTVPAGFLRDAAQTVQESGGLVIADEVQCGFGRTGAHLWGFQRHGIEPDIVTMGKPMGNGFPIAALATRPEVLDALQEREGYFNTFAATPVAAAVGNTVLDVLEQEGLLGNAVRVGEHLRQGLQELSRRDARLADVRGTGLFIGVEMCAPADGSPCARMASAVINGLRERRVLIGAAGRHGNVLKIRPPLCLSTEQADQILSALEATLRVIA